jgi:hypothetical protein
MVVEDQPDNRQALPNLRSWKLRTAKSTRGYRKGARGCHPFVLHLRTQTLQTHSPVSASDLEALHNTIPVGLAHLNFPPMGGACR